MNRISINAASIYRNIGVNNFFTSIYLNEDSPLLKKYPQVIHGILFYTLKERNKYEGLSDKEINFISKNKIRIITEQNIQNKTKNNLQFDGIPCEEVDDIYYIPESFNTDKDDKGKRVIPLQIKVPIKKTHELEDEELTIVLTEKFLRNGIPLLIDEKYKYLGIKRALTNDHVEDELLKSLNIDRTEIAENPEILLYYYSTKQKITSLNTYEKEQLQSIKSKITSDKLDLLYFELKKHNPNWKKILEHKDQLNLLNQIVGGFDTIRIGFRNPPNHINLKSYIHIVLRHFEETQIGDYFMNKSKIPYILSDLKSLASAVIDTLDSDLKEYFKSKPSKRFKRYGERSIYYNGDYYCIYIEPDGRVSSFFNYERKKIN